MAYCAVPSALQVEKLLDDHVGPIKSMLVRLVFGLAGCTAICAAFPFLPPSHSALLGVVAALGTVST